jgi:endonuclease YncB( thermonuclease family)
MARFAKGRRRPRAWGGAARYRRGLRQGVVLVVLMGVLALTSSGVLDGLMPKRERAPSFDSTERIEHGGGRSEVSGRAYVLDGDTIEVGGVRVRLQGLHCPEAGEPGGSAATSAMQRMTRGDTVRCTLTGERSYDRIVGTCYVADIDLTAAIIRQGTCARCARHDPGGRYLPVQREAGAWRRSVPRYCS